MMGRVKLAFALMGCAFGSLQISTAGPVPSEKPKAVLYHPTRAGAKWVFTTGDRESTEAVIDAKEKDGAWLITVGYGSRGEILPSYILSVSDKGLCVLAFNVADLTEPFWLLKLPLAENKKWDAILAGEPWGRAVGTAKAKGPERVEVPAGIYQAIRVEMEVPYVDGRRGKARKTFWYAPEVGKIKEVDGERVEVLKSFAPGKE